MVAIEKVKEYVMGFETDTGNRQGVAELKTVAKNSADAAKTLVQGLKDSKDLFDITIDAVGTAVDAAADVISEMEQIASPTVPTADMLQSAITTCQKAEETIKEVRAAIAAEKRLADEYGRNNKKLVLVVGGGVSGLMTAWILLDKGYRVSFAAAFVLPLLRG